jgi:predicted DNA-binding protein
MAMKIPLSFKEREKNLYEFVRKKKSPSAYLKELIEEDMKKRKPKQQTLLDF